VKSQLEDETMRRTLAALLLLAAVPLAAQQPAPAAAPTAPAARPEDVASIDAIMKATYDVISGPAGPRDWDRFRSLFAPDARLIPTACPKDQPCRPRALTMEDYIKSAGQYFSHNSFYEVESHRVEERYGHVAHVFSTYESRKAPGEEPFSRGINSFQLFWDGSRWSVVSIFWNDESSAGPIPARYLPKQ
jgi:hypothetical protein